MCPYGPAFAVLTVMIRRGLPIEIGHPVNRRSRFDHRLLMNLQMECTCGERRRLPWFWFSKQQDLKCRRCEKLLLEGSPGKSSDPGRSKSKTTPATKTPTACPGCHSPVMKNAVICLECGLEFASGKRLFAQDSSETFRTEDSVHIATVRKRTRRATSLNGIRLTSGFVEKKFVVLGIILGLFSVIVFGLANDSNGGIFRDAAATLFLIGGVLFPVAGLFGTRTTFSAHVERGTVVVEISDTLMGYPLRNESVDITDYEVVRTYEYDKMFGLRSICKSMLALCVSLPWILFVMMLFPLFIIALWVLQPLFQYLQKSVLPGLLYETLRAVSIAGRFCNPVIVCDQIRSPNEAMLISRLVSELIRLPERGGLKKSEDRLMKA